MIRLLYVHIQSVITSCQISNIENGKQMEYLRRLMRLFKPKSLAKLSGDEPWYVAPGRTIVGFIPGNHLLVYLSELAMDELRKLSREEEYLSEYIASTDQISDPSIIRTDPIGDRIKVRKIRARMQALQNVVREFGEQLHES